MIRVFSFVIIFLFTSLVYGQDDCRRDRTPPVPDCPTDTIMINTDADVCGAFAFFDVGATDNCNVPTLIPGFTYLGGSSTKSYFISTATFTWEDAFADAAAQGGYMATVTSLAESNLVSFFGDAWIGLTDRVTEGTFNWVNGEPFAFSNFQAGEPDNGGMGGDEDYVAVLAGGEWTDLANDGGAMGNLRYILEVEGAFVFPPAGSLGSGSLFPVGVTRLTYTFRDIAGNESNCDVVIEVTDQEFPVFSNPPADTLLDCDQALADLPIVMATDACNPAGITATLISDITTPGACPQESMIVRTWEATDDNGNTSTFTQTVTVQDTTPPTPICQTTTVMLDANGEGTITSADINNGSTDNCSNNLTLSLSQEDFTCDDIGTVNVTLYVEDECGNIDSCMVDVTVEDNIDPVITNCPNDVTITLESGLCRTPYFYNLRGTDNCVDSDDLIFTLLQGEESGAFLERETTTTYEFEVSDGNGNTSICSWEVTVLEFPVTNFTLSCNFHLNLSLDQNCEVNIGADMILEGDQYGCFEDYTVELFYDELLIEAVPTSPIATAADIDRLIYVSITDPETNNNCWGTIQVEDYLAPSLTCDCPAGVIPAPGTCEFFCFESVNLAEPIANDNCGIASLVSTDEFMDAGMCDIQIVKRTWTATDLGGNTTTCEQEFRILPATIEQITAPANFDDLDQPVLICDERCPDSGRPGCGTSPIGWNVIADGPYAGHPSPYDDLYPCNGQIRCFGTGTPGGGVSCSNINMTFQDTRVNSCSNGSSEGCYKLIRTWTVLDWCLSTITTFEQVIKIEDSEGPSIEGLSDVTISTDVWRCAADWTVTEPRLTDNCSSDPLSYSVSASAGNFVGGKLKDLGVGVFTITYTAEDCCGNQTDSTIQVTVIDDVPPTVVCDQHTVVDISTTTNIDDDHIGTTKIFANTFDDGSFDNCSSQLWFKAIRMDELDSNGNGKPGESVIAGDWEAIDCDGANGDDDIRRFPPTIVTGVNNCGGNVGLISNRNYNNSQSYFDDFVKFCCEDIVDGPIMVVFRVFDIDPTCYEFRNVFPAGNPTFDAWYASNPDKAPSEYTGVIQEAMSLTDWPTPNAGPGPLAGHFSDCMVEVTVQDKVPPFVVAPPNLTVTCDFWFEFDDDNPNDYTDILDGIFGKVIEGSAELAGRDSIITRDRICPAHPRFAEFAPASPFDDPCYDDQYDLWWGIDGYVLDNCDIDLEQTIIPNLHCGAGTITRRWRAADAQGNWSNIASQTVTIINCREFYVPTVCWRFTPRDIGSCDFTGGSFSEKLIEWPCDIELNRCQGPTEEVFKPENLDVFFDEDRRPRYADDNCSLIASTYEDNVFTFVDSACLKIFREWHVIDWCRYEDNLVPFEWEWTQVIKLLNTEGPKFTDCGQTVCGYGNPANPNADQCVGEVVIEPGITDDCSNLEDLRIDYKFDYFNDGRYDEYGYSSNYGAIYPFPNPDNLPIRRFEAVDYAIRGFYPVGEHRILWAAEDGCGNVNVCEYILIVEDCKPPRAYCLPGVSTIPMPKSAGGYIEIWANDFDLDSYDNCTEVEQLRFAFSDDPTDTSIRRTCDDVDGGGGTGGRPEALTIYVFDEADNYSTCAVSLLVTDCNNQSQANINGSIQNQEGELIDEVMVRLEGDSTSAMSTELDGSFHFDNLDVNQNYSIRPEKDVNPLNGVSTYDLVLISKHILGITPLASPYKMIAADVNKSGSITAFDMVELRKLILYINTTFPDNTSWRFVPDDFVFPTSNPFASAFPEAYSINDLTTDMITDFVAIKVGDVNDSAKPNELTSSEDRNATGALNFVTNDIELTAGETYEIQIAAEHFEKVAGYQFTLNFDSELVEVVQLNPILEGLNNANFGTHLLQQGVLTTSWNAPAEYAAKGLDSEPIFTIHLRAKRASRLSEAMGLSKEYTRSEAYSPTSEGIDLLNVQLTFESSTINEGIALYQNVPNPFKNETIIGFVLPKEMPATLLIYDLMGREIYQQKGTFASGYNEWSINRSVLGQSGLVYYTLVVDKQRFTKKMMIIE